MAFTDASLTALRVFREVAERGTLTAAATALGYTQSAVSRQVAALERAAGARLLERRHDGVRLTAAGRLVLRRAAAVVDEVDAAARELAGLPGEPATVRFGWFASAGAALVPRALAELRRTRPSIAVTGREDGSSALVRALRAGTLDVALLSSAPPFRAPDAETPPLEIEILTERGLRVAVPAGHPLARGEYVDVADLHGRAWIAGPAAPAGETPTLGVWPGLDERPQTVLVVRDWLAKLALVAAGCGLTTVPASMGPAVPEGVRVLPVRGGPREQRRLLLARLPGPVPGPVADLAGALRAAAVGS
ncbi:LysR family transcriptional regulator [Nonomuraea sp. NPDC049646]|uniref:LysR family transcriptional regulator n=1 Tax=unclassified Nonomuraea TaxID=2593643 RepID=UPI0037A95D0B